MHVCTLTHRVYIQVHRVLPNCQLGFEVGVEVGDEVKGLITLSLSEDSERDP